MNSLCNKLKLGLNLLKNMGWSYIGFRLFFELKRRSGLLKKKFPTDVDDMFFVSLEKWRQQKAAFFFANKDELKIKKNNSAFLEEYYQNFFDGKILFFNSEYLNIGNDYDWVTNPQSAFRYDINKHWLEISDLSSAEGDIKYVWEKSRFSYIYHLIRYDYHYDKDLSKLVIDEILSWIEANPINKGPNYKCSQEISIRLLNWTFALYYYSNSPNLTEEIFQNILNSIYRQTQHIFSNINFSRKSVRNNHAITETLALYLIGLIYPFFPESGHWKRKGKRWFEQEILYQIYDDGSYLQFSMNYHRVVIQLLTWAFYLADLNNDRFSDAVYDKGKKTLQFLLNTQESFNGWLPNYGSNDGALFFPLNNCHYRNYRPQLNALYYFFYKKNLYSEKDAIEDTTWYNKNFLSNQVQESIPVLTSHHVGGFYNIQDEHSLTFIRCGKHKDRPAHADNLHVDIWYKGENIFHDSGTFQYNTEKELINFFSGTSAHNTVSLGRYDQMQKGPRFIWFNWSQAENAKLEETEEYYYFEGRIKAFGYLSEKIVHKRIIKKDKSKPVWLVEDFVDHNIELPLVQHWNTRKKYLDIFSIVAFDENNKALAPKRESAWYSSYYGKKEKAINLSFSTTGHKIITTITIEE